MKFYFVENQLDYNNFVNVEREKINAHNKYIRETVPEKQVEFVVKGYSYVAKKEVNFKCDFQYSVGYPSVNWRERLICPITGFNNRLRFSIHVIDSLLNLNSKSSIYIMEQVTSMYSYMSDRYINLIGSEYLGEGGVPFGAANERGIRNEDCTKLSYAGESFDTILSYDVFEHIPNFGLAFEECYRVLKKGGRLLFSAPFNVNSYSNLIRAVHDNSGKVVHLLEPEFHGDPVGDGGILCYQHFGWEVIDELKKLGFSRVSAVIGWSEEFCYFEPQIQFIAIK